MPSSILDMKFEVFVAQGTTTTKKMGPFSNKDLCALPKWESE